MTKRGVKITLKSNGMLSTPKKSLSVKGVWFLATFLLGLVLLPAVSGLTCPTVAHANGSLVKYTLFLNSSGDGALVWDRDNDSVVDAADLFGGRGLTSRDVDNGFEDLALLDINGDGIFNPSTDNFTAMQIWHVNNITLELELIPMNNSYYRPETINLAYRDKGAAEAGFWKQIGTHNSGNFTSDPNVFTVNLTTTSGYIESSDFMVLDLDNSSNFTVANTTGCDAAAASSSSGGSSKPKTWADLFVEDERELREKGTITLSAGKKDRIRLRLDGDVHVVDIVDVTEETVTVNISSKTQQAVLHLGEEKQFDVDGDAYYDLLVKLNSIENSKVSLALSAMHEAIKEDTPPPSATEPTVANPEPQPLEPAPAAPTPVPAIPETAPVQIDQTSASSNKWFIIAAVLVVLVATVVYFRKSILSK